MTMEMWERISVKSIQMLFTLLYRSQSGLIHRSLLLSPKKLLTADITPDYSLLNESTIKLVSQLNPSLKIILLHATQSNEILVSSKCSLYQ